MYVIDVSMCLTFCILNCICVEDVSSLNVTVDECILCMYTSVLFFKCVNVCRNVSWLLIFDVHIRNLEMWLHLSFIVVQPLFSQMNFLCCLYLLMCCCMYCAMKINPTPVIVYSARSNDLNKQSKGVV
jgi:hypothetical protein